MAGKYEIESTTCHYCEERLTDFSCDVCGLPVCDECCVQMTLHNQIDYPLCLGCEFGRQEQRAVDYEEEKAREDAVKAKKAVAAAKRRANYWKPESIERRRLAKLKRQKDKYEANIRHMESVSDVVDRMFRGM